MDCMKLFPVPIYSRIDGAKATLRYTLWTTLLTADDGNWGM